MSAEWQARYRKRRYLNGGKPLLVDATGTHRRLQALANLGWSIPALERKYSLKRWQLDDVLRRKKVGQEVESLVRRIYDDLWNVHAPMDTPQERYSAARSKVAARKAGWPPPAAWDDDEIDDPQALPKGERRKQKNRRAA